MSGPRQFGFAIAVVATAVMAAACGGRVETVPITKPRPTAPMQPAATSTAGEATPEARFESARATATAYVQALAAGNPQVSAALAAPADTAGAASLVGLSTWLHRLPLTDVTLEASPVYLLDDDIHSGVLLAIAARFGKEPRSTPVPIGERVLELELRGGRWVVIADRSADSDTPATGLSVLRTARVALGTRSVVIYPSDTEKLSAAQIIAVVDALTASFGETFGTAPATERPVVVVTRNAAQLRRVCNCRSTGAIALQLGDVIYVDNQAWRRGDGIARGAVIAHELAHLFVHAQTGENPDRAVPYSLYEGIAMVEYDRYLRRYSVGLPLAALQAAYRSGYDSAGTWRITESGWHLRSPEDIDLAYLDAYALVQTIIRRHGGLAAVYRLIDEFRREQVGYPDSFTTTQLDRVFRRALHVGFASVEREARRDVARHAGQ
jgi:hypothetical protein